MIRMSLIRVILPPHLRTLAQVGSEVKVEVKGQVTQRSVLDALEATYPMLRGTIRDHTTQQRRPFLRFFACEEDLSHEPPDAPLPEAVASGKEPLVVLGAIAGGSGRVNYAGHVPGIGVGSSLLKRSSRSINGWAAAHQISRMPLTAE